MLLYGRPEIWQMFVSACSQWSSLKHFRAKVPFLKFMAICWKYLIFGFCLSHRCLTDVGQTAVLQRRRCSLCTMGILRTFRCLIMGSMRFSVTAWLTLDSAASRGSLLSQGCAARNNDPAADREDVFVFGVRGLALFKWSSHFLQQWEQTECRNWGRWPTSCCMERTQQR